MYLQLLIASTFGTTGYSQDESGSSLQIEEIIVTAQKENNLRKMFRYQLQLWMKNF